MILETEWVLRYVYDFKPQEICETFKKLFGLKNVKLNNAHLVAQALNWHQAGLDFAAAFHLALSQQHAILKTFDDKFIKCVKQLRHCSVERP